MTSTLSPAPDSTPDGGDRWARRPSAAATSESRGKRPVWRRPRYLVAAAIVLVVALPAWSLGTYLARPSTDPTSVRAVEWLRRHGGSSAVNQAEHVWYEHHKPPVGGHPRQALPAAAALPSTSVPAPSVNSPTTLPAPVPTIGGSGGTGVTLARLAPVRPLAQPALPGEGVWVVAQGTATNPIVATTEVRPDPVHTSLLAGVARIQTGRTRLELLPGTEEPGGSFPTNGQVPPADRPHLLAAFNAGFQHRGSNGGWTAGGRTVGAMRPGAASLVIKADGTATVGQWGRDVNPGPDVVAVRQNLDLVVDGGVPVPGVDQDANRRWGATLGNAQFVWRSGVGVTADGALVYVGGPGLSIQTLAAVLVAAGAVRAMELDINTIWVQFFVYHQTPTGLVGTKLLPEMHHDPNHYLVPQTRDFFALVG